MKAQIKKTCDCWNSHTFKSESAQELRKDATKLIIFFIMSKEKHHKNTIERAKKIRQLTEKYYEQGNNARCYKAVWRKYIYPVYPMCYRTYLNALAIPTPPPQEPTARQLTFWDLLASM